MEKGKKVLKYYAIRTIKHNVIKHPKQQVFPLTGIPKASGLTGTLKGSAASIFITFLITCKDKYNNNKYSKRDNMQSRNTKESQLKLLTHQQGRI